MQVSILLRVVVNKDTAAEELVVLFETPINSTEDAKEVVDWFMEENPCLRTLSGKLIARIEKLIDIPEEL